MKSVRFLLGTGAMPVKVELLKLDLGFVFLSLCLAMALGGVAGCGGEAPVRVGSAVTELAATPVPAELVALPVSVTTAAAGGDTATSSSLPVAIDGELARPGLTVRKDRTAGPVELATGDVQELESDWLVIPEQPGSGALGVGSPGRVIVGNSVAYDMDWPFLVFGCFEEGFTAVLFLEGVKVHQGDEWWLPIYYRVDGADTRQAFSASPASSGYLLVHHGKNFWADMVGSEEVVVVLPGPGVSDVKLTFSGAGLGRYIEQLDCSERPLREHRLGGPYWLDKN